MADLRRAASSLPRTLGVPRPFDWRRDCPADLSRSFPPIVGYGRGRPLLTPEIERHLRMEGEREYDRTYEELTPVDGR